ncbi:MAG TPA: hypothetical protein VFA90_02770 [Terriglobales bacterium]|nr:hypothetical protein [Terriglobales bacterium]
MKLLIVVEDIFEFKDGTLHFSPFVAIAELKEVKAGDRLELRRPDGTTIHTTLYGFDRASSPVRGQWGLSVNKPLTRADIPIGTEVWKAD